VPQVRHLGRARRRRSRDGRRCGGLGVVRVAASSPNAPKPEPEACPDPEPGVLCETCGVPANGHTVCGGYEKGAEGGRCGGCGRARGDHAPCLHYRVNLHVRELVRN
jgi:hypothetical protein